MFILLLYAFVLGWLWHREVQAYKPVLKKIVFHNETAGYQVYEDGSTNIYDLSKYNRFYNRDAS